MELVNSGLPSRIVGKLAKHNVRSVEHFISIASTTLGRDNLARILGVTSSTITRYLNKLTDLPEIKQCLDLVEQPKRKFPTGFRPN